MRYCLIIASLLCSYAQALFDDVALLPDHLNDLITQHQQQCEQRKTNRALAKQLLYSTPCAQGYDYIITWYEWRELAVSDYLRRFDRTHTSFGSWGFEQLMKPIAHLDVIKKRQAAIALCEEQRAYYHQFCALLDQVQQHEEHLLLYYQEHDRLNERVEKLYYTLWGSILNKSKWALDYSYMTDVCNSVITLATILSIKGLATEFLRAQSEGRAMNIIYGMRSGFAAVINNHNPYDSLYQTLKADNQCMQRGTIDRNEQYIHSDGILQGVLQRCSTYKNKICDYCNYAIAAITHPTSVRIMTEGTFGDRWSYYTEQFHLPTVVSLLLVGGQVIYQDQALYSRIKQHYDRLLFLFYTHRSLQHRMVHIAQLMRAIIQLIERAQEIPALKEHPLIRNAYLLLQDEHNQLYELAQQLQLSTYTDQKQFFYSRGQVLITHKLLQEIKSSLLPLMQAVAIIDGFIAVCHLYQEHKDMTKQPFCFVEFVETEEPSCSLQDGWLPLIADHHVLNSYSLGCAGYPRNMLLTGPNGGGKSSVLKLMGGVVLFAQSWGIVPAAACKMSLFKGMRTSFNPQEDVKNGISTFMAQKKQLCYIADYIKHADPAGFYMLLIDEPYRGTIEVEAEKRTYTYAQELVQYPQVMMAIASHLKKPIDLERDTDAFINKQLKIEAHTDGTFTRTFKLIDGAAQWWFKDIQQRMRFIDWLHVSHPEAVV